MVWTVGVGTIKGVERVDQHTVAVDGDRKKLEFVDDKHEDGRQPRASYGDSGKALKNINIPTLFKVEGVSPTKQTLADITYAGGVRMLVPKLFKDIVEDFEPDVHQFFPATIIHRNKPIADRYIFNICNRLDTVNRNLTVPEMPVGTLYKGISGTEGHKFVHDVKAIASFHAWHEKFRSGTYFSDELYQAIQGSGLTGLSGKYFEQA